MPVKRQPVDPFALVRTWNKQLSTQGWWQSFELPDGTHIDGVGVPIFVREAQRS